MHLTTSFVPKKLENRNIFMQVSEYTVHSYFQALLFTLLNLWIPWFLSGKVRQLQYPPPALFVPVKAAAIIPPAGQNRQVFGKAAKAKAVASFQTTPVNPYSKAAKGMKSDTQYLNP